MWLRPSGKAEGAWLVKVVKVMIISIGHGNAERGIFGLGTLK